MNVLIVGLGNIGKRHLESLSIFKKIKKFLIIEKNSTKSNILKKKYSGKKFNFYKSIKKLKEKLSC